jgi:hypothetical protein
MDAVGRIGGAEAGDIPFGFHERREVGSSRTIAFDRYYRNLAATSLKQDQRLSFALAQERFQSIPACSDDPRLLFRTGLSPRLLQGL